MPTFRLTWIKPAVPDFVVLCDLLIIQKKLCSAPFHLYTSLSVASSLCYSEDEQKFERSVKELGLLQKFKPQLLQFLNIQSLLPHLASSNLITPDEESRLSSTTKTDMDKKLLLLQIIPSKGLEAFQLLLSALEAETSHEGHKCLTERLSKAQEELMKPQSKLYE